VAMFTAPWSITCWIAGSTWLSSNCAGTRTDRNRTEPAAFGSLARQWETTSVEPFVANRASAAHKDWHSLPSVGTSDKVEPRH
jgi:hypothetical protein